MFFKILRFKQNLVVRLRAHRGGGQITVLQSARPNEAEGNTLQGVTLGLQKGHIDNCRDINMEALFMPPCLRLMSCKEVLVYLQQQKYKIRGM